MQVMKEPLMSIIVPVYNVEKYLCTCVDSILSQSFRDYELILVDDGSPDSCPVLCDEYAASDKRIKVIHKKNGGISDARNVGIDAAIGKYLLFIDSDDYIAEQSLEKIDQHLKIDGDCDIAFLSSVVVFNDGSFLRIGYHYDRNMIYKKNRNEILNYFINISQFPSSACIKLIRRKFINDKKIYFTKGILCEDFDHSMELLLSADSFNYFDFPYYYYRSFREGAISSSSHTKLFYSLIYIIEKWYNLSHNIYIDYSLVINEILSDKYCQLLWYYYSLSKKERAEYKSVMKKYSELMNSSNNKRVILIRFVYRLFGLYIVSDLINLYYSFKLKPKK